MEIALRLYPLESISKWELSSSQAGGWVWVEQPGVDVLVRCGVVLSLSSPLGSGRQRGRVTYTGGFVLPGVVAGPGQKSLPKALENACIEQVAYMFQHKDHPGSVIHSTGNYIYDKFADVDLLPMVRAVLARFRRVGV